MVKKVFRWGERREAAEFVKRAIAAKLAEKLREQPEAFDRLVEIGLVDESALAKLDAGEDLGTVIRQFKDRISEMARTEPSVLARLEVRPLDVLAGEDDEPAQLDQPALTVVFSDLEGFTAFNAARGDGEASALLADHYDAVEAIVRSRGGRVMKTLGDGHMLAFEQPAAAVMGAIDLVAAAPDPLRLRAGAHRGSVVRTTSDLLGHVVNVAARVTDLAEGGMSLVTTEVRDAAGRLPAIVFEPARSEHVAGVEEPVEVCEVHAA